MLSLPLTVLRLVRGPLPGSGSECPGGRRGADRVWAGQAVAAGGPQAVCQTFSHSCWRCQPSGRWRVRRPRPRRAVRAATWMRSRRMVAARAFMLHKPLALLLIREAANAYFTLSNYTMGGR